MDILNYNKKLEKVNKSRHPWYMGCQECCMRAAPPQLTIHRRRRPPSPPALVSQPPATAQGPQNQPPATAQGPQNQPPSPHPLNVHSGSSLWPTCPCQSSIGFLRPPSHSFNVPPNRTVFGDAFWLWGHGLPSLDVTLVQTTLADPKSLLIPAKCSSV
jgi:hypothetical protein